MSEFLEEAGRLENRYSLKTLYFDLLDKPRDQLDAIENELLHRQRKSSFPKFEHTIAWILEKGHGEGNPALCILWAALASRQLVAFVLRPVAAELYTISSSIWYRAGDLLDVEDSIMSGELRISAETGKPNSALREVYNRPIYVDSDLAIEFARPRALSAAYIERICKEIVRTIEQANPEGRARKKQFEELLRARMASLTSTQVEKAWAKYALSHWRLPGRPRARAKD